MKVVCFGSCNIDYVYAVSRKGAAVSIPYAHEVDAMLKGKEQ